MDIHGMFVKKKDYHFSIGSHKPLILPTVLHFLQVPPAPAVLPESPTHPGGKTAGKTPCPMAMSKWHWSILITWNHEGWPEYDFQAPTKILLESYSTTNMNMIWAWKWLIYTHLWPCSKAKWWWTMRWNVVRVPYFHTQMKMGTTKNRISVVFQPKNNSWSFATRKFRMEPGKLPSLFFWWPQHASSMPLKPILLSPVGPETLVYSYWKIPCQPRTTKSCSGQDMIGYDVKRTD